MTNGKCQEQEEEQEQQLLPLYDLGFAAGKKGQNACRGDDPAPDEPLFPTWKGAIGIFEKFRFFGNPAGGVDFPKLAIAPESSAFRPP